MGQQASSVTILQNHQIQQQILIQILTGIILSIIINSKNKSKNIMKVFKQHFILLIVFLVVGTHGLEAEQSANAHNFFVSFSSVWNAPNHNLYKLDSIQAWSALVLNVNQWIQASPPIGTKPCNYKFVAIIIQGRANIPQWVTKYRVSYSLDGIIWEWVDNGKEFIANFDQNTKIRNDFEHHVWGLHIRIHPTAWFNHISLRFDAIYYQH